MLSSAIQEALNRQIAHEFASSYLYLSMSAYCATRSFDGFAHWLRVQSQEETAHALKLFDMVLDRGGQVALMPIEAPPNDFESILDVMQRTLAHEQQVTALIQEVYELATKEDDYITQSQLQWFLTEQVEEEKTAARIVDQLKLIGGQGTGLFVLDRELAARGVTAQA
ncbi:MAG: ferritin [Dehalococcoidia bacterium]